MSGGSADYATFHHRKFSDEEETLLENERTNKHRESSQQPALKNHADTSTYRNSAIFFVFAMLALVGISYFSTRTPTSNESTTTMSSKIATKTSGASPTRPNFVFIVADDMGFGSIGYEQYDIEGASPFMTDLLKQGVFFTNYYAQEECTPSRASLLTGRYPSTIGMQYYLVETKYAWGLNLTEITLPQILGEHGYKSYGIGKWHLGHYSPDYLPTARGFDQFLGYTGGQIFPWSKIVPLETDYKDSIYMDTSCYSAYTEDDFEDYSTYLFTHKARSVIQSHDFDANPMFLYMSYQAVHDPFNDKYNYTDGLPTSYFEEETYKSLSSQTSGKTRLQYALSLYLMDQGVKSLVNLLDEKGQLDNTYVIVTSDNGGCYNAGGRNGDLRGSKGTLFEGK